MEIYFGLLVLCLVLGNVTCERCNVNDSGLALARDCPKEQCDSDSHLVCFQADPGDHLGWCTCAWGHDPAKPKPTASTLTTPSVPCTFVANCTAEAFPFCRTQFTYCLNNYCKCLPKISIGSLSMGRK